MLYIWFVCPVFVGLSFAPYCVCLFAVCRVFCLFVYGLSCLVFVWDCDSTEITPSCFQFLRCNLNNVKHFSFYFLLILVLTNFVSPVYTTKNSFISFTAMFCPFLNKFTLANKSNLEIHCTVKLPNLEHYPHYIVHCSVKLVYFHCLWFFHSSFIAIRLIFKLSKLYLHCNF